MFTVTQSGFVGLFNFLFRSNICNINSFQRIRKHQSCRYFTDHTIRCSNNQDTANTGSSQRLTHCRGMAGFIKNCAFYCLNAVLFAFCRSAAQNFRTLYQQTIVNNSVALILVRHTNSTVTLPRTAGTYKGNNFHSSLQGNCIRNDIVFINE